MMGKVTFSVIQTNFYLMEICYYFPMSEMENTGSTGLKRGRKRSKEKSTAVRSLDRGLAILECLGDGEQLSLTEIAKRVDLAYSTTHRLLDTLLERDFVSQDDTSGKYRIGAKAFDVGSAYAGGKKLNDIAHSHMTALVEELGETVNLAVLSDVEAMYVHQVESSRMMRTFVKMGAKVPLYCTGVGKTLVAWKDDSEIEALLANASFKALTEHTITNFESYMERIREARAQGYALDDEEVELGVRCVAAPVFDKDGDVIAALSLSAPATRVTRGEVLGVARAVMHTAQNISRQLGWRQ